MRREELLKGKLILFFVSLLLLILSACSNSPDSPESETDGSGRVSLSIRWLNSTNQEMAVLNPDGTLNCAESGIVRIHAEIYDAEGLFLADSGPDGWDCEHHSGLIEGVSSGTGYKLVIYGKDEQGNNLYRGEQANITVVEGQTTPLEKVEAFSFVTELLEPAHQETVTNGTFTLHWSDTPGAARYHVLVSANSDLSAPVIDTTITATTYAPVGLTTDFIYYWGVAPIDQFGNMGVQTASFVFIIKEDVNLPPELEAIGNRSVQEGKTLTFVVRADDPDGDSLTYSAGNLPTGAQFNTATGQFVWTPGYYQGGKSYPDILFRVTDNGTPAISVSERITITVGDGGVNHPPELNQIGSKTVNENSKLQFTISAVDPDTGSDEGVEYSAGNLPDGAKFDPATHIFTWTPGYDRSGSYQNVLFTATDDGTPPMSDSEAITISVGDVNRPPVLDEIGNKATDEEIKLRFPVTAHDPDGDDIIFSAASTGSNPIPSAWSFEFDIKEGSYYFSWTPDYNDEGVYEVTFTVTDTGTPGYQVSEIVTISVGDVNRSPVLSEIGNRTVNERATLSFTVTATDPDGDNLTYSATNLPSGASFNPATQRFTWTPDYDMAGTYTKVRFTVTDDGIPPLSANRDITITVNNVNRPPVLNTIGSKSINENQTLNFTVTATDPDEDGISYTASDLPSGATLNQSTGAFNWSTDYGDDGTYNVTFTAKDNGTPNQTDAETVTITVVNQNGPPELEPIGDKTVNENSLLSFTISATDPDGDDQLTYSAESDELPSGWTFNENKRKFTWTPGDNDSGSYDVAFTVTDDGTPSRSDSETITITVANVNRAPVLGAIGNKTVAENQTLSFSLSASDPDGNGLVYSAANMPSGATLNPSTGAFSWATDYGDAGNHNVTFTVTDDGTPSRSDSESITITVVNINRPPVLNTIGNKSINENQTLNFTVSATDPDGDGISYTASDLPSGATLNPSTGAFSWSTDYGDAGTYNVTFTAKDNGTSNQTDSETITITVGNINRPPLLNAIGDQSVSENETLRFTLSATDPDGDDLAYSATGLPSGASLNPATGVFNWSTDYGDGGNYTVTFTVTDDGSPSESDSETITITVGNINRPPVLDAIGDQSVRKNKMLSFTLSATDPDGDDLTYSATGLPPGAFLNPATGSFVWITGYADEGDYEVTFTVSDDGTPSLNDSETITLTLTADNPDDDDD
ncbi:MAG: putative Ig domain-containing protein [Pseudomonadota bacterium]